MCVVVPCFDEAHRLDVSGLASLARLHGMAVILVDDGSTDSTPALLEELAKDETAISVETLTRNSGKGEAVRLGLRVAIESGAEWVGYLDADLATPPEEFARLAALARSRDGIDVVLASRVALLGHDLHRSAFRHYTGRVFATLASWVLGVAVYDTQCGAKLFRVTPPLRRALADPFISRWAFDVELLGRLARDGSPADAFWEEPLLRWHDAPGSRRTLSASVRSSLELWKIRSSLRARR